MITDDFQIGDVVMLRSGSPHMTIEGLDIECNQSDFDDDDFIEYADVMWWCDARREFVREQLDLRLLQQAVLGTDLGTPVS